MNNNTRPAVVSVFVPYEDAPELAGRVWLSHDGPVFVTSTRSAGGMYLVRRSDGREHFIRPAFIAAALAESEIVREPVEEIAARSAAAAVDLLDDDDRAALARRLAE